MLIFSRSRSPWVAAVFIVVIAVGAFMRYQLSTEEDASKLEIDKKGFVEFRKDIATLNVSDSILNSQLLFELYRCGVRSITERNYCEQIGEKLFQRLTAEQRAAARPIIEKHFLKR